MRKKLAALILVASLLLAGCGKTQEAVPAQEALPPLAEEPVEPRWDGEERAYSWDEAGEQEDPAREVEASASVPLRSNSKRTFPSSGDDMDTRYFSSAHRRDTPSGTVILFMEMCRSFEPALIELYFQEDPADVIDYDDEEARLMILILTKLFSQVEYSIKSESIYEDTAYVDLEITTFSMEPFIEGFLTAFTENDYYFGVEAVFDYIEAVDLSQYPRVTNNITVLMEYSDGMWWLDDEDDILYALLGELQYFI